MNKSKEELAAETRRVLDRMDREIAKNPFILQPVSQEMIDRMSDLVAGVEVDLDKPIEGPVDI